jgi:hypothetical protein
MSYKVKYENGTRVNGSGHVGSYREDELEDVHRKIRIALQEPTATDIEVALVTGVSSRTVFRYRKRHGIANYKERS